VRFVLALLLLVPAVTHAAPDNRPGIEGRVGNWCLNTHPTYGLMIHNRLSADGVRVRVTEASNGWIWVETEADTYVLWTAGNFSQQDFEFGENGKVDCVPSVPLPQGPHRFGTWTLTVDPQGFTLDHDQNPHSVAFPRTSSGTLDIRALQGSTRTLSPGDTL